MWKQSMGWCVRLPQDPQCPAWVHVPNPGPTLYPGLFRMLHPPSWELGLWLQVCAPKQDWFGKQGRVPLEDL